MLETIIRRKWYLKKHLEAPLLKERESCLTFMAEKRDYSHNYLLSLTDYLLLIVTSLKLEDGHSEQVSISSIRDAANTWSKTKKNHPMKRKDSTPSSVAKYMDVAFSWLAYIGRLDGIYTNNAIILNRLFTRKYHKLRYITYPLLKERTEYLQMWEDKGAAMITLRSIAAYQLHLIDYLHVEEGRMISVEEIQKSADSWMTVQKSGVKDASGRYARRRFISYTSGWLSYMGQLIYEDDMFPIKGHVIDYLDWLERDKGYSSRTTGSRYSQLKTMMLNLKVDNLEDITPSILDNYIRKRHDEGGCSRKTVAEFITVLRGFFRYAEEKGLCNPGLAYSLKAPRVYNHEDLPSFVPWDILQQILQSKKDAGGIGVRDYAVLLLLSVYGLRCSEITNMKLKDIDWRNETLYLKRAKNCKPQVLPLRPIVGDAIIRYIKEARFNKSKNEYLFLCRRAPHEQLSTSTIYNLVKGELKDKGLELRHYGPHSLRHTCATRLINTGHSLKEIADLLGHVQLDTTRIYAKVDIKNLRKVADMNWEGLL
jgi:site-specific recombinase XerD